MYASIQRHIGASGWIVRPFNSTKGDGCGQNRSTARLGKSATLIKWLVKVRPNPAARNTSKRAGAGQRLGGHNGPGEPAPRTARLTFSARRSSPATKAKCS